MNAATSVRPEASAYEGSWTSADGAVVADLVVGAEAICIHEWSSLDGGKGNTRRAISQLRSDFPDRVVCAVGIGDDPGQASWRYWIHLRKTGAVEHVFPDDSQDDVPV